MCDLFALFILAAPKEIVRTRCCKTECAAIFRGHELMQGNKYMWTLIQHFYIMQAKRAHNRQLNHPYTGFLKTKWRSLANFRKLTPCFCEQDNNKMNLPGHNVFPCNDIQAYFLSTSCHKCGSERYLNFGELKSLNVL